MVDQRYFVLTGGTSGLGLEAARAIAKESERNCLIVGARNPDAAASLKAAIAPNQLSILELDTSSIASVESFAMEARKITKSANLAAMVLNAGVQITDKDRVSIDGYELTFATNVLGHMLLFSLLEQSINAKTIIVSTASGTHDGDHKLAKPYGFRGGKFPSAQEVAQGNVSASSNVSQRGRDRYSTSKLCNIMFTYAMARRYGNSGPRFIAFDPGLMPGTGLARTQSTLVRAAWNHLLPLAVRFIDGASTAKFSGKELTRILLRQSHPEGTGLHLEFTGKAIPSSTLSHDEIKQDELIDWIDELLVDRRAQAA